MKHESVFINHIGSTIESLFITDLFIKSIAHVYDVKVPMFFGKKAVLTELRTQSIALGLYLLKAVYYPEFEKAVNCGRINREDFEEFQAVLATLTMQDGDIFLLVKGYLESAKLNPYTEISNLCCMQLSGSLYNLRKTHGAEGFIPFEKFIQNIITEMTKHAQALIEIVDNRNR